MEQYRLYLAMAPVAALFTIGALVISVLQRRGAKSLFLEGFLLCSTMILALSFCELLSAKESNILRLSHYTYIFIAFGPVCWFLFAYQYGTGKRLSAKSPLLLLFVPPLVTIALAFADERLHLIWAERRLMEVGPLRINHVLRYGPWFWVHSIYSYLLFLVGAIVILKEFFDHYKIYRRQAFLVIGGTAIPLLFNALYIARVFPGLRRDFSPLALALSGILFSLSIVKYRLLELNPPPRQEWAELIEDGILIVNAEGRIVDANKAAALLLDSTVAELLGSSVEEVLPGYSASEGAGSTRQLREPPLVVYSRPISKKGNGEEGVCISLRRAPESSSEGEPAPASIPSEPDDDLALSPRELEVARLLAAGLSIKQIGAQLFISTNTVKTHERHIMKKTHARDREALARLLRSPKSEANHP
jgi:DNA-binding CsgD family transcriptional regulator/PAS domain-containing protein